MAKSLPFSELSLSEQEEARNEMRKTFAGILTAHQKSEDHHTYVLQLEVVSVHVQSILNHKVLFVDYASDKPVLAQKMYLHYVAFLRQEKRPEEGVFEELSLPDSDLYRIYNVIKKSQEGPSQVLHIDGAVLKVMSIPEFTQYLPPKLRKLDFSEVFFKEENSGESATPPTVGQDLNKINKLG